MANFRLVAFNEKGQLVPPTGTDTGLVQLLAIGTEQSYTILNQANLDSLLSLISSQDAGSLHHHDSRYFTKLELTSTDPSSTGASRIMAKNPYGGFSNVQQILEALHFDVDTLGSMVMEWQNSVITTSLLAPPLNPVTGDRYLLGLNIFSEPSGVWDGFGGQIAEWTGLIWKFTEPSVGMFISADDVPGKVYYFSGTEWQEQAFENNVGFGYIDITAGVVSLKNLKEKSLIVGDENNIAVDVDTGLFGQIEATKDGLFVKELALFGGAIEYPEGSGLFPDNIADQSITHGKLEGDEPGRILGFNPGGDAVSLEIVGDVKFEATDVQEAKTTIQPSAVKSGMIDWGSGSDQIDDSDIPANNVPINYVGGNTLRAELEGIDSAIGQIQQINLDQDAEDLTFLKLDGSRAMTGTFDAGNQTIVNVAEIRVSNIKDQMNNAAIDLSQTDALRLSRKIVFTGSTKKIENLADGTVATDAINFGQLSAIDSFLQSEIAKKLDKAGDTMSGPLDMGGNFVRNVGSGILTTDAVNLGQLQNSVAALEAADAANLQTSKDYTDAQVLAEKTRAEAAEASLLSSINQEIADRQAAVSSEADARAAEDLTFLKLDGSRSMTGSLNMSGTNRIVQMADGQDPLDGVNKSQLDSVNTNFTSALSTETANRISADNALSDRLVVLEEDPVTKTYVDAAIEGLAVKPAVKAATTGPLGGTYDNGADGVGATITLAPSTTLDIDGVTSWALFDGVLVKNEVNAAFNGRYFISQIGNASTPWILTRCGLCDEPKEITSAYVWVQGGTQNESTGWIAYVGENFTQVGVQPINWFQFSGEGTFTAGLGLQILGNQFSVKLDGTTLTVSGAGLRVNQNILDSINQEIQDRIAGDNNLQSQLDAALSSISNALASLEQADQNLLNAISAEQQARIAGDSALDAKIDQEILDRQDADVVLDSRIQILEADPVTKNYVDVQNELLQSNIDSLANTVTQEVGRVDQEISALETTVADNYDAQNLINVSVQNQIDNHEQRIGFLETDVNNLQNDISVINNQIADAEQALVGLQNRADATDVSIAELNSDISDINTNVAANTLSISEAENSISLLNQTVAVHTEDIDSLQIQIDNADANIADHEARIYVLELDPVTKNYVDTQDAVINERIDFIVSNTDPEALDSLAEIVEAFQNADSDINNAISSLAQTAADNLQAEVNRATAAEAQLASDIAQETAERIAADSLLSGRIDGTETNIQNVSNFADNIYQDLTDLSQSFSGFVTSTDASISGLSLNVSTLETNILQLSDSLTSLEASFSAVSLDFESFKLQTETAIEELEQSIEALESRALNIEQDLANEITRATTAEAGLDTRVTALENAPQPVLLVNGQAPDANGVVDITTDQVVEGVQNKYYSTALFSADLSLKSTTDLQEGTNLYYTQDRFDAALSAKTTTDVQEGDNLYYTDERVQNKLGNVSGHILPDTDEAYDLGSFDQKFKNLYLSGSSIYLGGIKLSDSDSGLKVEDAATGSLAINTDNIIEGSNLFYTAERVVDKIVSIIQNGTGINWAYDDEESLLTGSVDLSVFSTTDLAEGNKLYFTNARVNEAQIGTIIPNATGSITQGDTLILTLSKFVNQISVLSNIIDQEIIRATLAESGLQTQINNLDTQVGELEQQVGEDLQVVLQDLTLAINNEQQARESADNALSVRIDSVEADYATIAYVNTEIETIDSKINYIISNTDEEALDSLTEIVAAFQAADENLEGAITSLSTDLQDQINFANSSIIINELAIANINQAIADLEDQVGEDLQQAIADLNQAIINEETARIAADAQVLADANTYADTSVASEAFLRENADNALSSRIANLELDPVTKSYVDSQDLAGLVSANSYADNIVELERLRAEDAENTIANNLAAEIQNRIDGDIDTRIYADNLVGAEESARIAADNLLSGRLDILELDPVTKTYVDSLAEGISIKPSVKAATTEDLNGLYDNGVSGVGSTITINVEILNIDGFVEWSLFDGVLVKDQIVKAENGRYFISQIGDETTPWVLTRCGLCDEVGEIPGAYVWVQGGDTLSNTGWAAYVGPDFLNVGVDDIIWFQFSGVGTLRAGLGLNLVDNEFSVKLDGGTLAVGNDGLKIADSYTQNLNDAISSESSARQLADSNLSERIDLLEDQVGEDLQLAISNLEAADQQLSNRLDVLELDPVTKEYVDSADLILTQELENLTAYSEENRSLINQETEDRLSDIALVNQEILNLDQSVSSRLDAEESARIAADTSLSNRLDILELDPVTKAYVDTQDNNIAGILSDEILNRTNADIAINERIDSLEIEIETNIQTAIAEVQSDLSAEEAARIAADEALQVQIDTKASQTSLDIESQERIDADLAINARIDNVLSNLDPEAIDSFTEVVAELQAQQAALVAVDESLQSAIFAEEQRAIAAESAINIALEEEVTARISADTQLQNSIDDLEIYAGEVRADLDNLEVYTYEVRADLDQEILDRESQSSNLQTQITEEIDRAIAAESDLQSQISYIVSNIDPEKLDSLTEIVDALDQEKLDRIAADQAITNIVQAHGAILDKITYKTEHESFVVDQQIIDNGYVELSNFAALNSIIMTVDRLAAHQGADYYIEEHDGITRIYFDGLLAQGASQALEVGENIFVRYQTLLDAFAFPIELAVGVVIPAKNDYTVVLDEQDITNGYVYLPHKATEKSTIAWSGRLALIEGFDYTIEEENGLTKIIFAGESASGGSQALQAGSDPDVLHFKYEYYYN